MHLYRCLANPYSHIRTELNGETGINHGKVFDSHIHFHNTLIIKALFRYRRTAV